MKGIRPTLSAKSWFEQYLFYAMLLQERQFLHASPGSRRLFSCIFACKFRQDTLWVNFLRPCLSSDFFWSRFETNSVAGLPSLNFEDGDLIEVNEPTALSCASHIQQTFWAEYNKREISWVISTDMIFWRTGRQIDIAGVFLPVLFCLEILISSIQHLTGHEQSIWVASGQQITKGTQTSHHQKLCCCCCINHIISNGSSSKKNVCVSLNSEFSTRTVTNKPVHFFPKKQPPYCGHMSKKGVKKRVAEARNDRAFQCASARRSPLETVPPPQEIRAAQGVTTPKRCGRDFTTAPAGTVSQTFTRCGSASWEPGFQ